MSTIYAIRPGYNSRQDPLVVEQVLEKVVADLRHRPGVICAEVLRLEPHADLKELAGFAAAYARDDLTLKVERTDGKLLVAQFASGSGPVRELKESCRRAFARLVIEAMHRQKMEVSLTVS